MRLTGKDSGPGTEWSGKWVIVKATGELEGIHGQGTYDWSSGTYEGKIHFDPQKIGTTSLNPSFFSISVDLLHKFLQPLGSHEGPR